MAQVPLTIISLLFWIYVVFSSIVLWIFATIVYLLTLPFDRRKVLLHHFLCFWAYHYVWLMPLWDVSIKGRKKISNSEAVVIVANHQSLLDILVLFGLFRNFKWVSKQVLFKIPIIGWSMAMCNYIALTRGLKSSITKMMRDCRKHLEAGSSVLIFPEGTRSEDGTIGTFRQGAFTLAKDCRVKIIPIIIKGTHDALPKHGIIFKHKESPSIIVRVLEPINPNGIEVESLTHLVQARITNEFSRLQPNAYPESVTNKRNGCKES